jgi:hypothetical protein
MLSPLVRVSCIKVLLLRFFLELTWTSIGGAYLPIIPDAQDT